MGTLRVISHTFEEATEQAFEIRIISARKATNAEINQYKEGV
jgi:uncharacterized DUF497 family protein